MEELDLMLGTLVYEDDDERIVKEGDKYISYGLRDGVIVTRDIVGMRYVFDRIHNGSKLTLILLKVLEVESFIFLIGLFLIKFFNTGVEDGVLLDKSIIGILFLALGLFSIVIIAYKKGIYAKELIRTYLNITIALLFGIMTIKLERDSIGLIYIVLIVFTVYVLSSAFYLCGKTRYDDYFSSFIGNKKS